MKANAMICDICGADMKKKIEIVRTNGTVVKRQNIGCYLHPVNGKSIKRCRKCYELLKDKKRINMSSYQRLDKV